MGNRRRRRKTAQIAGSLMKGPPVPFIRPPWKRTSRRSSDGRERSCSRVRRPSRSATGFLHGRQRSRPSAPRRLVRRLGHRECRRGPWHPTVRSVPVPVPDNDGFPRGNLSSPIRPRRPEQTSHVKPTNGVISTDLDVLDPVEGRMNEFAAPDGLSLEDLQWCLAQVARGQPIRAASVTSFDPASDVTGRAATSAVGAILALVAAVAASSRSQT
jgi:hypothetical protein